MVLGDFNMIIRVTDKNNTNINRRMMSKFRDFVDEHELKEMYMHGRRYTWSNERDAPTLTKIDRILTTVDWELDNAEYLLQALSTGVSDHAPLLLTTSVGFNPKRRFRFEIFWTKLDGFEEAVTEAWVCDPDIVDPYKRLDTLLRNTARHLQAWGQRKMGNVKILMRVARWVIHRLDCAQENRALGQLEIWLRKSLKQALLGLAALERTIDRQRSRMKWLKEGDANTKLFQAVADGRRSKNFIAHVKKDGVLITDQELKEKAFFEAYER
ncbi:uncharacterized protein [Aegilops tauschii subsp. strangulata]|uniref:uncharacterized protein n=1 Tax=Aegilops tauschii subsp. strangulata TaxID=200361 RepID=UPI003CC8A6E4